MLGYVKPNLTWFSLGLAFTKPYHVTINASPQSCKNPYSKAHHHSNVDEKLLLPFILGILRCRCSLGRRPSAVTTKGHQRLDVSAQPCLDPVNSGIAIDIDGLVINAVTSSPDAQYLRLEPEVRLSHQRNRVDWILTSGRRNCMEKVGKRLGDRSRTRNGADMGLEKLLLASLIDSVLVRRRTSSNLSALTVTPSIAVSAVAECGGSFNAIALEWGTTMGLCPHILSLLLATGLTATSFLVMSLHRTLGKTSAASLRLFLHSLSVSV